MPPSNEKQRTHRKTPQATTWTAPAGAASDLAKQRIVARFDVDPAARHGLGEAGDAGFDAEHERERRLANAEADLDAAPDDEASYRAGLEPPRRH